LNKLPDTFNHIESTICSKACKYFFGVLLACSLRPAFWS
jgi:hypothetical protein